jgi:cytochrome P450 / NADPH-cytochrome P450 reductase
MHMLENPHTLFTAQQEVDRVVGKDRITAKHLKELKYINAVLREKLRLIPTEPGFARAARQENKNPNPTLGGGNRRFLATNPSPAFSTRSR